MLVSDDEKAVKYLSTSLEGLNPCFSGCWSRTTALVNRCITKDGLNPCFSGCWSRTRNGVGGNCSAVTVLILVLVDVGLGLLVCRGFKNG